MKKRCSRCKKHKELTAFCACRKSKDGLQSQCKTCKCEQICEYNKTDGLDKRREYERSDARREYKIQQHHKHKVSRNISRRIRQSLRRDKRGAPWEQVVGFMLSDLKSRLEEKFVDGMTWENYGSVWHIDHIRPVTSFEIISETCDGFKQCWSLSNLQPLFKGDNLVKANKFGPLM